MIGTEGGPEDSRVSRARADQSPRSRHEICSELVARSALDRVARTLASPDSAVEASSTSSRGGSSSSISSILGPMVLRVCWNSAGDRGRAAAFRVLRRESECLCEDLLAFRFSLSSFPKSDREVGTSPTLTQYSRARALVARRPIPDARSRASRRASSHYSRATTRASHTIFSASCSHFSTAAAGTSPLSPPCSTHVSLGLGGVAAASPGVSPPGGSPKNLMA